MWALLLVIGIQATTLSVPGWSVFSPTPLIADADAAARCVMRHQGAPSLHVPMRCRVVSGGRMTDCATADGRSMSRRDLDTLQCVARSQRLPAETTDETMVLTIRVAAR